MFESPLNLLNVFVGNIFNFNNNEESEEIPLIHIINIRPREREENNLQEIKSNNNNFMQEENIKYNLYPLYINWKKIETKKENNIYYNIFKIYGYFGEAIFLIINEAFPFEMNFNHNNFLTDLYLFYLSNYYAFMRLEERVTKKIINIYDDVISLIKNKIMIFKEISVFLIVMRIYEIYFSKKNDKDKILEVLKYEYIILSNIKDEEYDKIYNQYFKKINNYLKYKYNYSNIKKVMIPESKNIYLNHLRRVYKKYIKVKQEK